MRMEDVIKKESSEKEELVSYQTWNMSLIMHISNWCDSKCEICPDLAQDYLALLLKHTSSPCSPLLPTRTKGPVQTDLSLCFCFGLLHPRSRKSHFP